MSQIKSRVTTLFGPAGTVCEILFADPADRPAPVLVFSDTETPTIRDSG